jgi:hypothetical protein
MKIAHNKKRNTLFLYESLLREYTKAKIEKDIKQLSEVKNILIEFFSEGKILKEELKIYKAVLDTESVDKELAGKILEEAKRVYLGLNQDDVFKQQSSVIAKVNRKLTQKFFSNYVPNYKDIASLQQVFGQKSSIPARMLMERQIIEKMTLKKETVEQINDKIDKHVIHSYLNAFNKKYSDLLENQKNLLKKYMTSSEEDNTDFMVFLNEELQNIAEKLNESHKIAEIKEDKEILAKLVEVKKKFLQIKNEEIDEKYLQRLLKFQKLVHELEN